MAFSRKQMAAAVAGTLSLSMLTGCPWGTPTATQSPAPAAATPAASPVAPVASPSAAAPIASPSTDATGTAAPSLPPAAPAASGEKVIVSGNVYDEKGATVDGATIIVKSLDKTAPYEFSTTTTQGSYVLNSVPEGANVEIIASKDGWTSRRRVGSFQKAATGKKNIIDFGTAGGSTVNADDTTGAAYFISDYPEIVAATPADEAENVDASKLTVKLTLSEALSADGQDALVDALRVVPANKYAVDGLTTTVHNYDAGEDDSETDGIIADVAASAAKVPYSLAKGDQFLDSSNKFQASWNAAGTEATFSFSAGSAALLSDDNEAAKYAIMLVAKDGDDKIEDKIRKQLGTNAAGSMSSWAATGEVVYNAFKEKDLSVDASVGSLTTAQSNWASTHDTVSTFEVAEDNTDPKLTGVDINQSNSESSIELTFSEPMAAYFGSKAGLSSAALYDLSNYSFVLGEKSGDAKDALDADATTAVTYASGTVTFPNNAPFYLATQAGKLATTTAAINSFEADSTSTGIVGLEVDGTNPNVVKITFYNRGNLFTGFKEIKARANDVADPAGNAIVESDADKNVVKGSI